MNMFSPAFHHSTQHSMRSKLGLLMGLLYLGVCEAGQPSSSGATASAADAGASAKAKPQILMIVGERRFSLNLANNATADAFAEMLPLTLDMPDLNANEKHVSLPKALPANASSPGRIHSGDIMLYGSQTLVVFYKSFPSPYSYSRIGSVADPSGLAQALGQGDVRIGFIKAF
jgi:hypothetical protein